MSLKNISDTDLCRYVVFVFHINFGTNLHNLSIIWVVYLISLFFIMNLHSLLSVLIGQVLTLQFHNFCYSKYNYHLTNKTFWHSLLLTRNFHVHFGVNFTWIDAGITVSNFWICTFNLLVFCNIYFLLCWYPHVSHVDTSANLPQRSFKNNKACADIVVPVICIINFSSFCLVIKFEEDHLNKYFFQRHSIVCCKYSVQLNVDRCYCVCNVRRCVAEQRKNM